MKNYDGDGGASRDMAALESERSRPSVMMMPCRMSKEQANYRQSKRCDVCKFFFHQSFGEPYCRMLHMKVSFSYVCDEFEKRVR